MQIFPTILMAVAALSTSTTLAAPYPSVLSDTPSASNLNETSIDIKRDTGDVCMLRGVFQKIMTIGSGGPGQARRIDNNNYFLFQRPGEARFRIDGNPVKSGWQTISSGLTGTAQNVDWYSDFNLSGWSKCRSSYDYHETDGTPEPREEGPCTQLGAHCVQCTVVFPC
ncbi:hypothetical protein KVT40_001256 [Elsinoe batatas]|uniref:Uncharacterized protein n=1 Tax=Elsinoe batatas TaxID=2601811 RepID=A0A8K0PJF1_9PEZI|nr:hypothetical protein KVT40_001256 [Elsinoe batatas]